MGGMTVFVILFAVSLLTSVAATRLEMSHVDAKHNLTVAERVRRGGDRAHRLLASGVELPVRLADLAYTAEYAIGSPPQRVVSAVDTASDLVWTQSAGCSDRCFEQELRLFDPTRSRTGYAVPCDDALCIAESGVTLGCTPLNGSSCGVRLGAVDFSGTLAVDVFEFGQEQDMANIAFACITSTSLDQPETDRLDGASGVIGLGRGALSLVSQIGGSRFSYCLTPFFSRGDKAVTSPMFVGSSARLTGDAPVTSVPLLLDPAGVSTQYYLPLVGLSIGSIRLDVPPAAFKIRSVAPGVWAGGVLVDTRVPFLLLVDVAYAALREEMTRQAGDRLVPPPSWAATVDGLDLCVSPDDVAWLPSLSLHFAGGEELPLPPVNFWINEDDAICMAVRSSADENGMLPANETSFVGSIMQQNFHLLYDLAVGDGVLSFQAEDCADL